MVDVDPEIFNNPTLGAAANGVFLDVLEAQQAENRAALIEGREPEIVHREGRYPGYLPENPSAYETDIVVGGNAFRDGSPVDVSQAAEESPGTRGVSAAHGVPERRPGPSAVPRPRTPRTGPKGDK